jgi:hypothetical protein
MIATPSAPPTWRLTSFIAEPIVCCSSPRQLTVQAGE